MKISAIVLTYNCENFLEGCLKSLVKFDEIVAVDGGSTDGTLKLLKDYNAVIHQHENISPKNSFPMQRNFGIRCASNNFVFFLDSDEAINPKIYDVFQNHEEAWMCWVPRVTMIDEMHYIKEFSPDPQARFMRVGYANWMHTPHEQIHEIPYVLNNLDKNPHVHTENSHTIVHWGYLPTQENIPKIRAKQKNYSTFQSTAERNIFKMAEKENMDVVDYLLSRETEVMKFE